MSRLPSLLPRRRAAAMRMRTPAEIRALTGPPFTSERPAAAELRQVAAEQEWPRLRIHRDYLGAWCWTITDPRGGRLAGDVVGTWEDALSHGRELLPLITKAWRLGVDRAGPTP